MMQVLSDQGMRTLQHLEGVRYESYKDVAGVLTIGFGHTGTDVHGGDRISHERAVCLLSKDVQVAEKAVSSHVTVPLSTQQFDALVLLTFNIGVSAFCNSTLLKVINQGRYVDAGSQIKRWVYSGGKPVLAQRRAAEYLIYTTGEYPI